MKTQLLKKISAFIMIIMMFSIADADAQRSSRNFMTKFNRKNDVRTNGNPFALQKNKVSPDRHDSSILWQKIIGGSRDEDRGAIKLVQGGYITCGSTTSPDGDFHVPANHGSDAYVVKLNSAGNIVWAHTYGGSAYDDIGDIIPTSDGGFIAIGSTSSNDGDVSGNHGGVTDVWVIKLNANGQIQWQKCYGGSKEDYGSSIVETQTGYAFSASSASLNGDVHLHHGHLDAWIVKISFSGNILFEHTYGGSDDEDTPEDAIVYNAADGTIIFSSKTLSRNGDVTGYHDGLDAWVVKIDASGSIIWKKTLGGSGDDYQNGLVRTADGNIVIALASNSNDGDVLGNNGLFVAWLVKLNSSNGNVIWNKSFTNPTGLGGLGLLATSDGGAVAMGIYGTIDTETWDAMVLKVDSLGNQEWIKIFGGSKTDFAQFGTEMPNGNILTSNWTESNDGDVQKADGGADLWIVALDNSSNNYSEPVIANIPIANDKMRGISLSNYPNPVSNFATISFNLNQSQKVSLKIYDMNGVLVKTLTDESFEKGQHQLQWNSTEVKAGIYILQFDAGDYNEAKKLYVIK